MIRDFDKILKSIQTLTREKFVSNENNASSNTFFIYHTMFAQSIELASNPSIFTKFSIFVIYILNKK
jgi:hypothetical protein